MPSVISAGAQGCAREDDAYFVGVDLFGVGNPVGIIFAGKLVLLRIIPHQKFAKSIATMATASDNRPPEKFRGEFADFNAVGRLGGWDLLARDYRKLLGELPSETLRRS